MRVAIVAATGSVGRLMASWLVEAGVLSPADRLILVGHSQEKSILADVVRNLCDTFHRIPEILVSVEPRVLDTDLLLFCPEDSEQAAGAPSGQYSFRCLEPGRAAILVAARPVAQLSRVFPEGMDTSRVIVLNPKMEARRLREEVLERMDSVQIGDGAAPAQGYEPAMLYAIMRVLSSVCRCIQTSEDVHSREDISLE
ncbi:MAG: hypothetical protein O2954_06365 [bacterium]|nr:hypothetical protein [bacterium]